MKVDSVITLSNNISCLLLDKAVYNDTNYYLAVILDENLEPTDDNVVLKEILEDGDTFVEREGDEKVLASLMELFVKSFNNAVSELSDDAMDD